MCSIILFGLRTAHGRLSHYLPFEPSTACKAAQEPIVLQYAERLPIGLEGVIRNVPAATIKAFYDRFYMPDNMAVVVVGDLPDLDATVASVAEVMGVCQPHSQQPRHSIPR